MTDTRRQATRYAAVVVVALLVALVSVHGPRPSSATFTSSSQGLARVAAAADWTPPTVTLAEPGPTVVGTVSLTASPADADSGVARVVVERRALPAGTWQTVCSLTGAPWTCSWQSTDEPDGEYALRARVTDRAGLETVSAQVRTLVANQATAVVTTPSNVLRGTVTLGATVRDAGTMSHTVRIEHAPPGGGYRALCTGLTSPYACSWDTTTAANGTHQVRTVVVNPAGRVVTTSEVVTVVVDNAAPSVGLTDPGSPLSGVRTVTATASDAHSGVAKVVVQAAPAGTTAWRDVCTATRSPWSCAVATTALADGFWSLRAVATDVAGNSSTSAPVAQRLVENTAASVALDLRTGPLAGTVQVGATAHAAPGITSVALQVRRTGAATWIDLCTDTVAPWSCDWNTLTVPNGTYELRAEMRDGLNRTTLSPVLTRTVTNAPFTGVDVQTSNGTGQAGRPDRGDTVTFTYSHEVNPATVLPGWDGSSRPVTVTLSDGGLFNLREDTLEVVTTGGASVNLGTISLNGDYIWWTRSIDFEATMVATTTLSAQGIPQTTVTLTLGSSSYRGLTDPVKSAGTASPGAMVWTPSSNVSDVHGRMISTDSVTESGSPLDREF